MFPPFTVDITGVGEYAAKNCQLHVADHQTTEL